MSLSTPLPLLDFADYLHYDDGTDSRYELVDGELVLMNPPTGRHALIIRLLSQIIEAEIERLNLDWVTLQGIGIRTGIRRSRLPDLCVLTQKQINNFLDTSAILESPAQLVIEIVSPESKLRDYRDKRSEYSAISIPEYWIVDPLAEKVTILKLREEMYESQEYQNNEDIASQVFPELFITPNQIFAI